MKRLTWLVLLCWAATAAAAPASNWHPLADIRETAAKFVAQQNNNPGERTTVNASELDLRLRLQRCSSPLEAFLPAGRRIAANTTVGVRCTAPRPWKLFVPVRVQVAAPVLVAATNLPAGTVLSGDDLVVAERDISKLHRGYLREGEAVTGMVLRRRLVAGQPLRNELLTAPNIIRRGQQVILRSGGGPVTIRMGGTALTDGRRGQRIQVKNRSSGRIVEGVVRSSEIVEIGIE
ncbi:MAG: flagellar basal body P-ring formation protein FlgA [Gammaproteobacteria bacterium]|nr:flagellar basal body P-ring formation protein FlgA [Gammaproteobacteria bacterium]